ncbi:MAG: dienelactone hydrolase family protein [Myxococcota bacterium]
MLPPNRPLADDFHRTEITFEGTTKPVWRSGSGPGVVIIHEIPGITPTVARFARIVRDRGFTVVLPELFGVVDKPKSGGYAGREILRACISREFRVLEGGGSSPICDWLRELCRNVHAELGGPGVGALGMCLTGNFALALMVDDAVMAPVLSQPSLPFPFGKSRARALHVSPEDLQVIRRRARDEGVSVLGLRFSHDATCPGARFRRLEEELGEGFEGIEIDSGPGNPWGLTRTAHSVLTEELVDDDGHPTKQALDRVLAFFETQLRRSA